MKPNKPPNLRDLSLALEVRLYRRMKAQVGKERGVEALTAEMAEMSWPQDEKGGHGGDNWPGKSRGRMRGNSLSSYGGVKYLNYRDLETGTIMIFRFSFG